MWAVSDGSSRAADDLGSDERVSRADYPSPYRKYEALRARHHRLQERTRGLRVGLYNARGEYSPGVETSLTILRSHCGG